MAAVEAWIISDGSVGADEDSVVVRAQEVRHCFCFGAGERGLEARGEGDGGVEGGGVC
jgi:hypothetical protein